MMELRFIELERLRPSPHSVRSQLREFPEIRSLAESIAGLGLIEPLVAVPSEEEGVYEVVVGLRRLEALRLLERERPSRFRELFPSGVPCLVVSLAPREALTASLVENVQHVGLTGSELGAAVHRLREEYGVELEDLEALTGGRVKAVELERALKLYKFLELRRRVRGLREPEAAVPAPLLEAAERGEMAWEDLERVREVLARALEERLISRELLAVIGQAVAERAGRGEDPVEAAERLVRLAAEGGEPRLVVLPRSVLEGLERVAGRRGEPLDEALIEALEAGLRALGEEG